MSNLERQFPAFPSGSLLPRHAGVTARPPGGRAGTADDLPMLSDSQFDLVALPAASDPTTESIIARSPIKDPALDDDIHSEIRRYYQRRDWLWAAVLVMVVFGAAYLYRDTVSTLRAAASLAANEAVALQKDVEDASRSAAALETERMQLLARQQELEARLVEKEAILAENEAIRAEQKSKLLGIQEARAELEKTLAKEIARGEISTRESEGRLVVDLVDKILFASGKAELDERGKAVLVKVAASFRALEDKQILIGGHTDNVPINAPLSDRFPSNWELSTARALAVVHSLSEDGQSPGARLAAQGFGEHRPVADNRTAQGRRRNRRIELVLSPMPGPATKVAPAR